MNENQFAVVQNTILSNQKIDEVDYILDDVIENFKNNFFHTVKPRCVYHINFLNNAINEDVNLSITHGYVKLKSEIHGLNKKIKNCTEKWI